MFCFERFPAKKSRSNSLITDAQREDLIELYQQGTPIRAAARIVGVNESTARAIIGKKINNGELRSRQPKTCPTTDAQREDLFKLYQQGNSITAAAQKTGVKVGTAGSIIRKHIRKNKLRPNSVRKRGIITNEQMRPCKIMPVRKFD